MLSMMGACFVLLNCVPIFHRSTICHQNTHQAPKEALDFGMSQVGSIIIRSSRHEGYYAARIRREYPDTVARARARERERETEIL